MGVPQFVAFLRGWVRPSFINYLPIDLDTLCIDANGLFHEAINDMSLYGTRKLSDATIEKKVIERIQRMILYLVIIVKPITTLIVCVDGVAPLAKISRQRASRFKTVDGNSDQVKSVNEFDRNNITPGTSFMFALDAALRRFFIKSKAILPPTIIYSSHLVPGEGEHKIMKYLKVNDKTKAVIYGMDADLVHLSLLNSLKSSRSIYLWRQRDSMTSIQTVVLDWIIDGGSLLPFPIQTCLRSLLMGKSNLTMIQRNLFADWLNDYGERVPLKVLSAIKELQSFYFNKNSKKHVVTVYDIISIEILKTQLSLKMMASSEEQAVRDFFAITLFLGNDFIHKNPIFNRFDTSITQLVDIYTKVGMPLLDEAAVLDVNGLCKFIDYIEEEEPIMLAKMVGQRCTYPFRVLQISVVNDELYVDRFKNLWYSLELEPSRCSISYQYNSSTANFEEHLIDSVAVDMASEYCYGLQWVCRYYMGMEVDRMWCYPYYRAPMMTDLKTYIEGCGGIINVTITTHFQMTPVHQLVSVMPLRSMRLLPYHVQNLMSETSPIIDQFDVTFPIDLDGRMEEWQGVSIISFVDIKRVIENVEKCSVGVDVSKWDRGVDLIIEPDPEKLTIKNQRDVVVDHLNKSFKRPLPLSSSNNFRSRQKFSHRAISISPTPITTVDESSNNIAIASGQQIFEPPKISLNWMSKTPLI